MKTMPIHKISKDIRSFEDHNKIMYHLRCHMTNISLSKEDIDNMFRDTDYIFLEDPTLTKVSHHEFFDEFRIFFLFEKVKTLKKNSLEDMDFLYFISIGVDPIPLTIQFTIFDIDLDYRDHKKKYLEDDKFKLKLLKDLDLLENK